MGLVTDQARSMSGKNEGLGKRISRDYPHAAISNDISHIYNLIAKHSRSSLSSDIIEAVKSISSHFGLSCQRQSKLRKIQKANECTNILGMLNYTETRWLSLTQCINRILDLWDYLQIYFEKYGTTAQQSLFQEK